MAGWYRQEELQVKFKQATADPSSCLIETFAVGSVIPIAFAESVCFEER